MHPWGAVTDVACRKAHLRARIAERRAACTRAAAEVIAPLRWADRAWLAWREMSPLARLAASLSLTALGKWLAQEKGSRSGRWLAAGAWGLRTIRAIREWKRSRMNSPHY